MIVKAITNNISELSPELQQYAFMQDESGEMDISKGKCYLVYALAYADSGKRYLVHTDSLNRESLWWMPAEIYFVVDANYPNEWKSFRTAHSAIVAYPSLATWQVSDGIIHGDRTAIERYQSEVDADPSFPTQKQLEDLNSEFSRAELQKEYKEKLKEAKERGWERPTKP
jgi:hypothetical protein